MDFEDILTNQPVVIDNGSGTIKAGFAGEEQPKTYFPSCIGRVKHMRVMAGSLENDTYIGNRAQSLRGLLKIRYPMEHGIVTNWQDMERIWQYLYTEELQTLPEEHAVLLTEAPLNPTRNREIAAQILFETFNVPALYTSIQAILALYASGRTTGVVLDSGDGVSHAVPVYEGFAIHNAIQRVDLAGRDVTIYLQRLLQKSGFNFETTAEREIVRTMKEKTCYLTLTSLKDDKTHLIQREDFVLPDGRVITLGSERCNAPEILFNPDMVGVECLGLHELVADSILKSDIDLRKTLQTNIVLSGGTTLTRGFGDRLLNELRQTIRSSNIKIYAPPERKYSTWIGGSILASLSTFKTLWVSAREYQEDPSVIHRKMF